MSNMLEQAIVDAAALREAALKNAEQSIIEKYAPQIKKAVEVMLENDTPTPNRMYQGRGVSVIHEVDEDGNVTVSENGGKPFMVKESELSEASDEDILQEEEAMAAGDTTTAPPEIEAPPSWDSRYGEQSVTLSALLNNVDKDGNIDIDLKEIELSLEEKEALEEPVEDLSLDSMDLEGETPEDEIQTGLEAPLEAEDDIFAGEDIALQEVIDMIKNVLEEEIEVDMGESKDGTFQTFEPTLQYEADKEAAKQAHLLEEEEEEDDESETLGQVNELHETITALKIHNEKLESVVRKMNNKLEETLLSNAKLLYQNRTLNDASLNERQKVKIVEAIGNAESPKEAKNLHETLKATVGSERKKGPQSLSESVNRKSNLSSMLNRRQNMNESKDPDDSFVKKMQRLAGIK